MEVRTVKRKWRHPIPVSLTENHDPSVCIQEIIDNETELLLETIKKYSPGVLRSGGTMIPIEDILRILRVNVLTSRQVEASGVTQSFGPRAHITLRTKNQHYFRRRFTLAHELGHIWLSRLAGPFTYQDFADTKDSNYEEEFICDLFAGSLLMPKTAILECLGDKEISGLAINRIAREFKVSLGAVLRRVASVKNSILLLWSEISNPMNRESEKTQRIQSIYPNLPQLNTYFVPLYCTARDTRFEPNIILRSLESGEDTSGDVLIRDFGSLPQRSYRVHNIFFRHGYKKMRFGEESIEKRRHDMATLIELSKFQ